jgi:hypothetical protein
MRVPERGSERTRLVSAPGCDVPRRADVGVGAVHRRAMETDARPS